MAELPGYLRPFVLHTDACPTPREWPVAEFVAAASKHGTRLELIDVPNGHHGFDTLDHTDESRRAVEQALDTVLRHLNQP